MLDHIGPAKYTPPSRLHHHHHRHHHRRHQDIAKVLGHIDLAEYAPMFQAAGYDDADLLSTLSEKVYASVRLGCECL